MNLLKEVFTQTTISLNGGNAKEVNDQVFIIRDLLTTYHGYKIKDENIIRVLKGLTRKIKLSIVNSLNNGDTKYAKLFSDSLRKLEEFILNADVKNVEELEELPANKFEEANRSYTYKAQRLLTTSVDNSVLICTYKENSRGIGKSTELLKKANELDTTLITHNQISKYNLDSLAQTLQIPVDIRYVSNLVSIRGMRMKNGKFLVDEGVSTEVIEQLLNQGNELVGGFVRLHTLGKVDENKFVKDYLEKQIKDIDDKIWENRKADEKWVDSYSAEKLFNKCRVIEGLLLDLRK